MSEKVFQKFFCFLFLLKFYPWRTVAVLERSDMLQCVGTALEETVLRDSLLRFGVFFMFLKHLLLHFAEPKLYGNLSGHGRRGHVCSLLCLTVYSLFHTKLSWM